MIPIPERKLGRLVKAMRDSNIFPVFLNQVDCIGPGRIEPVCAALEACLTELKEYLQAATEDEVRKTFEAIAPYYQHQISLESVLARQQKAVDQAAFCLLVTLTQQRYYGIKELIGDGYRAESRVLKEYPELGTFETEEGLLPLDTPGVVPDRFGSCIYYKQHTVYYHQFLRRGFGSNPNYAFLAEVADYQFRHPDQRVSVAIDHTRLAPSKYAQFILEKDRDFGPPLKLASLDDPHSVGLTVHRPDPATLWPVEYDRAEFLWSFRDGKKTLQIEEIYPVVPSGGISADYVLTRYVHSQRDVASRVFVHLDGAVKVYPRTDWPKRFGQRLPDAVKVRDKVKLFRADGEIPDNDWSRLVSLFFQQNLMVPEYLNPDFQTES